jgi:DNA polymerase-3 subunit epsilon
VAFDLETTGLDPITDRIVEIGAVRFDGEARERGRFQHLVNPRRAVSETARAVHGISDLELASAPEIEEVLRSWRIWLAEEPVAGLVAHNARFDASFLIREIARCGAEAMSGLVVFDTLALARRVRPGLISYRLDALVAQLGLAVEGRGHRALADSLSVMRLWLSLDGPSQARVAYGLDPGEEDDSPPRGWEGLSAAIERGDRVRMEYAGGTRGATPRDMTPLRFAHLGGTAYVVGLCHLDNQEKRFRLDRIVWYERIVIARVEGGP